MKHTESPAGASPWWSPSRHLDRRGFLLRRTRIKAAVRRWFEEQGFVEVEPAALQVSPGNETHLHAFSTTLMEPDGRHVRLYLHTSPEFACKKLLAAGEPRIFAFAPVFRNRERGAWHHPEFTMLEWYRAREPYRVLMDDCRSLLAIAAEAAGARYLSARGQQVDPYAEPEHLTVAEAFERFAGIDLAATLSATGGDRDALAEAARTLGLRTAADDTWGDIFSRVLTARVEPNLGIGRAVLLDKYPVSEAALARTDPDDARFAQRFELYACGVEIANGFAELTDVDEQRRRFELCMAEKARIYGERYPIDEEFLAAMAIMPPACGAALGFERLVMLATGARHIEQVIWTPVVEAGEANIERDGRS
ncbi:MAG TPA: EF-P lysine aminoacylase EpmA [Hyphomicrobiaceae bacterium]|nr:EF-P lysine aminoacylase EpmA [Hyphomicrobiaceae bacterium]